MVGSQSSAVQEIESIYIRKEERSKVSNLSFYLRKLEKEEQTKSELSRRKE